MFVEAFIMVGLISKNGPVNHIKQWDKRYVHFDPDRKNRGGKRSFIKVDGDILIFCIKE